MSHSSASLSASLSAHLSSCPPDCAPAPHPGPLFAGLDIGSATVKLAVLSAQGEMLFARYQRHYSQVRATLAQVLHEARTALRGPNAHEAPWHVMLTGSGALSLAQQAGLPFVQEVLASSECIRERLPLCDVAIELGGEDAKLTFFTCGAEQRMNETCAGGTGAFIDHMAAMLHTDPQGLDRLARHHTTLYPIASRCGVFAKTDILPLLNEGCAREDIAASIFQAVVEQTITGLACGRKIKGRVAFLGGPLAFLGSLRQRFVDALGLLEEEALFPEHAEYFVALGAAQLALRNLSGNGHSPHNAALDMLQRLAQEGRQEEARARDVLPPLFAHAEARAAFEARHRVSSALYGDMAAHSGDMYLGFDMGSTTSKAVAVDAEGRILHTFYGSNQGEPLHVAVQVLRDVYAAMPPKSRVAAAGVTGYGSGLLRAALGVDVEEVETVAHWTAARHFMPEVSYVLDIGGQDIKCLYIRNHSIDKIQLNEACSSGCGSFVETFAASLGMSLEDFVRQALAARNPVDLGTRCTVFMNSRVKQAQKEGAAIGDIAAGLAYAVIRNALYKVIKIKDVAELGQHVMAQGGAFHNDALLRALELCLGRPVLRPGIAGLMGAFGAALLARDAHKRGEIPATTLIRADALAHFHAHNTVTRCQACANHCQLTVSRFSSLPGGGSGTDEEPGGRFVSGNRCERGAGQKKQQSALPNMVAWKNARLFDARQPLPRDRAVRGVVGLPRALNMYENYPLWFTLFTRLGFRVELSAPSTRETFALGGGTIPSQTLCYPAKLCHGHVADLVGRGVDSIFFPCVPLENKEFTEQDHRYNCPVVGGYPEILQHNMDMLHERGVAFYSPFVPLERRLLPARLARVPLFKGIGRRELQRAVGAAFDAQEAYQAELKAKGEEILRTLEREGGRGIILAAHPYHIDAEVHHGIPEYINALGLAVLTEDSVAHLGPVADLRVVNQWTFHARLYRAAALAAERTDVALVHLVSFGCGLSALTAEQMEEILTRSGRVYTQIKIDEGQNLGPARIRIRSLLASMRHRADREARAGREAREAREGRPVRPGRPVRVEQGGQHGQHGQDGQAKAAPEALFTPAMRETHTILISLVAPFHSRLMASACQACGYKTAFLPEVSREAVDAGLRHVNNDACYPAIVTVGQLVHAVQSGAFAADRVALLMYQTGGGCRATNYMSLLRKAMQEAGLSQVPLISFNLLGQEKSPGFRIDWALLKRSFMSCCLADLLARLLHRVEPYEAEAGAARRLSEYWLEQSHQALMDGSRAAYARCMKDMALAFESLPLSTEKRRPRVAIVGEILIKYHEYANNRLAETIVAEGGEVVLPDILDFFLYCLYDEVFRYRHLSGSLKEAVKSQIFRRMVEWFRAPMLHALRGSRRFEAPVPFSALLDVGRRWVSLGQQAGEGWLLTAEMVKYLASGVENIICVQPFGCLPNHITGKGMFREIKRRYPEANVVAMDYDQGSSESNQLNRIKLMMDVARRRNACLTEAEVVSY